MIAFRGTDPEGLRCIRPSPEGIYGPGVYWATNPLDARAYSERGGGVIVARLHKYKQHASTVVTGCSDFEILGIIPTSRTVDRKTFLNDVQAIVTKYMTKSLKNEVKKLFQEDVEVNIPQRGDNCSNRSAR